MPIPSPLIHYSDKPLECPRGTPDPGNKGRPNGLWVSVGDAWLIDQYERWRENPCGFGSAHYPHQFKHANEIILADTGNILVISDETDFRSFNDRYSEHRPTPTEQQARGIPWSSVRKRYQGIIIAPHLEVMAQRATADGWSLPVAESYWYYTWIVASGCLWDVSVIEDIETSSIVLPPY
jgi:hypothetical protein